jgi:hypothetical protein
VWIVQSAPGTNVPVESKIWNSTSRKPPLSVKVWRNVYQPLEVIVTGVRQVLGDADGFGHGLAGNVALRLAFVLVPMMKPVGTVPALNA